MKNLCRFLALLSLLGLAACESVFVEQPLGDEVVVLDKALWEGQWTNGEAVITTTVMDAEKGILQAAWVERGQDGAKLEMATGFVRKTGDVIYLNLPNDDAEHSDGLKASDASDAEPSKSLASGRGSSGAEYHWARLVLDEHRALMWWPNQERFRAAVKAGNLPGSIKEDKDVVLGELSKEQEQMINSPEANLLSWTEPLVFVRIGD